MYEVFHSVVIRENPPSKRPRIRSNFLTKGLFLTSTTQTLPTFNGGNCSFDVIFFLYIFGCKILAKFQCGIDVCMMSSIYPYRLGRLLSRRILSAALAITIKHKEIATFSSHFAAVYSTLWWREIKTCMTKTYRVNQKTNKQKQQQQQQQQ